MRSAQNWLLAKDEANYWKYQAVFVVVHAILVIGIAVVRSILGTILEIRWRRFMTHHVMGKYFSKRAYYLIDSNSGKAGGEENPDARIQTDISLLVSTFQGLFFAILEAMTGLFFQFMLVWMVIPVWTGFAVVYTLAGSLVSIWIMWWFTRLNYDLERREADWRYSLTHVRSNAESIAFYKSELIEKNNVTNLFDSVMGYQYRLVWANTGMVLYQGIYSKGLSIVPLVILTNSFLQGKIDFGGRNQIAAGFTGLANSLNFLITNNGLISQLSVAIIRLGALMELSEEVVSHPSNVVTTEVTGSRVAVQNLKLNVPGSTDALINNLAFDLTKGGSVQRLLVVGKPGAGKSSLLRCLAGLWPYAVGSVTRPACDDCIFLPQQPYMPSGSLRDQFWYPDRCNVDDQAALEEKDKTLDTMLQKVGMGYLPNRFPQRWGHKDDWSRILSLGEQQRVAAIRSILRKPKIALLDEATSALSGKDERTIYTNYVEMGLPFLSVGHRRSLLKFHDAVLELKDQGEWQMFTRTEYEEYLDDGNGSL